MWSQSNLMTITVAHFGSAALSKELLSILCLVQKMFPIMFLLPLSFSRQIIRYRPCGGPQAVLAGSCTNPRSVHLPFFISFLSLYFFFCLSLPLSHSVYIQMLMSRGEPASELSLRTTPFRLQISQGIQCTREFLNTDFLSHVCQAQSGSLSMAERCQTLVHFFHSCLSPSGLPLLSPCLPREVNDLSLSSSYSVPKQHLAL